MAKGFLMTDTATEPTMNGAGPAPLPPNGWVIKWLDHEWRSTETTTQQVCAVSETLGIWDWSVARPDSGPRQLATWIAVLWSTADDEIDLAAALAAVLTQPLANVVNALTVGS